MRAIVRSFAASSFLLFLLASPIDARAASCPAIASDPLACGIAATSRFDSVVNPPVGEDAQFFSSSTSGRPSVVFVLDTSAQMRELPIDVRSPSVRTMGTGCANALLNALRYEANPCVDGLGNLLPAADLPPQCDTNPSSKTYSYPSKYKLVYDKSGNYQALDWKAFPNLFQGAKYYRLDLGWAADSSTVSAAYTYPTRAAACTGASDPAACEVCLDEGVNPGPPPTGGGGYWLDPTNPDFVAFKGKWLNFYPPKYVTARRVLREQIVAMDSTGATRQGLVVLANGNGAADKFGCYGPTSTRLVVEQYDPLRNGVALDALHDGARRLLDLKPPCGSFAACVRDNSAPRLANRGNTINSDNRLFASPISTTVGGDGKLSPAGCPTVPGVVFTVAPDGVCRGVYDSTFGDGTLTGRPATCAPYAEALLNVGQYLSKTDLYDSWFTTQPDGGAVPAGAFLKKYAGAGGDYDFQQGTGGNASVCPAGSGQGQCDCPKVAVIFIAGGRSGFDDNLPANVVTGPAACGAGGALGRLASVAKYLRRHEGGMQPSSHSEGLRAGEGFDSPVFASTHVIGLGSSTGELIQAARAGGGAFIRADSAQDLKSAINQTLANISTSATSFSVASVSAVQSRAGQALLVPRFIPSSEPLWEGHLSKYELFSEDACGCVGGVGDVCDLNQDGQCGGIFMRDSNGDPIVEAKNGFFVKATLRTTALPDGGTLKEFVAVSGCDVSDPRVGLLPDGGTTSCVATPVWDAAERLANRNQVTDPRKIYTVIDNESATPDRILDSRDRVIEFAPSNAAVLEPYLNIAATGFCEELGSRVNTCLDRLECARVVIRYVRGEDVFDEDCDGLTTDPRRSVLGDIFHSSPVVVEPPLASNGQLCALGLSNQCVISLFKDNGKLSALATPTAYEDWRDMDLPSRSDYTGALANQMKLKHRPRIALVGANDGMLHAFHTGSHQPCGTGPDEPRKPDGTSLCAPSLGYYDQGTGDELWAFIPTDQLAKLPLLLKDQHQYFVDATPMVRDVWADSPGYDFKKQPGEFHTVAVVGERRGGTAFFALDITDTRGPLPATAGASPVTTKVGEPGFFRWTWPAALGKDSMLNGQSYADFLPTPPPIGPVRVKAGAGAPLFTTTTADTRTYTPPSGTATKYDERWVVMLNGGHDTLGVRGHSVSLIDVWRGGDGADPTRALRHFGPVHGTSSSIPGARVFDPSPPNDPELFDTSVTATPGMIGFGPNTTNPGSDFNGLFFDTAVVGDMAGQVWALRFNDPDPATWSAGRALDTANGTSPCDRQPFFQPPSLVVGSATGALRAALGSGDRFNLRDTKQGECSAQNLLGCVRRGCTVEVEQEFEACGAEFEAERTWTPGGGAGAGGSGAGTTCQLDDSEIDGLGSSFTSARCCTAKLEIETEIELKCPGVPTIKWEPELKCEAATRPDCAGCAVSGFGCKSKRDVPFDLCARFPGCATQLASADASRAGFWSTRIFSATGGRGVFNNGAGAQAYDLARLVTCSSSAGAACASSASMKNANPYAASVTDVATETDDGWYFHYGLPDLAATTRGHYAIGSGYDTLNERTATASTVLGNCAIFNSLTPRGGSASCSAAPESNASIYRLDLTTGGICARAGLDAAMRNPLEEVKTVVPPPAPQISFFVSPAGKVSLALVGVPQAGGNNVKSTGVASNNDPNRPISTVVLPRELHDCRHAGDAGEAGRLCP